MPTDTFQGCEYHQAAWATFSGAPTGNMYPRNIAMLGDSIVFSGPMKSTSNGAATAADWGTDDERVGSVVERYMNQQDLQAELGAPGRPPRAPDAAPRPTASASAESGGTLV